jgi:hypothetical protein
VTDISSEWMLADGLIRSGPRVSPVRQVPSRCSKRKWQMRSVFRRYHQPETSVPYRRADDPAGDDRPRWRSKDRQTGISCVVDSHCSPTGV